LINFLLKNFFHKKFFAIFSQKIFYTTFFGKCFFCNFFQKIFCTTFFGKFFLCQKKISHLQIFISQFFQKHYFQKKLFIDKNFEKNYQNSKFLKKLKKILNKIYKILKLKKNFLKKFIFWNFFQNKNFKKNQTKIRNDYWLMKLSHKRPLSFRLATEGQTYDGNKVLPSKWDLRGQNWK